MKKRVMTERSGAISTREELEKPLGAPSTKHFWAVPVPEFSAKIFLRLRFLFLFLSFFPFFSILSEMFL